MLCERSGRLAACGLGQRGIPSLLCDVGVLRRFSLLREMLVAFDCPPVTKLHFAPARTATLTSHSKNSTNSQPPRKTSANSCNLPRVVIRLPSFDSYFSDTFR